MTGKGLKHDVASPRLPREQRGLPAERIGEIGEVIGDGDHVVPVVRSVTQSMTTLVDSHGGASGLSEATGDSVP